MNKIHTHTHKKKMTNKHINMKKKKIKDRSNTQALREFHKYEFF